MKDSQHGFTSGRSCLTNLLDFMEEVTEKLDEGIPVDIVYLDFAKAFDKVPHARLLRKVKALGVEGNVLLWLEDWLKDRKQKVGLNGKFSGWSKVISGVPQGSVLGPLLILIYINDIDDGIVSKLSKFADDTKLCKQLRNTSDRQVLERDLTKIHQWSIDWQMLFNIDKCTVMHIGRNNPKDDYKMGNNVLKESNEERDLGVIVSNSLKVAEQCRVAAALANKILGMIKRTIVYKNKLVILNLYKALVRPKLEYCIQVWSPYLQKDINVLERVQKRATKMIPECRGLSYEERLNICGLTTLRKCRLRGDLIETFKLLKGFDKMDCKRFFKMSSVISTRGHNMKLGKKFSRTGTRKNFFSQRVIDGWNKLPQEVVDPETVNQFKNRLDKFANYG